MRLPAVARGSSMRKQLPPCRRERSSTRPPSSVASRDTMARPRPKPLRWSRSGLPTWKNSSKTRGWCTGAMPMPLSRTSMRTRSPRTRAASSTRPPAGVALIALSSNRPSRPASNPGSVVTASACAFACRLTPASRARSWWAASSSANRPCSSQVAGCACRLSASSWESRSRPSRMSAIVRMPSCRPSMSGNCAGGASRRRRARARSIACSGCRRSWLLAARKRSFARCAPSACCISPTISADRRRYCAAWASPPACSASCRWRQASSSGASSLNPVSWSAVGSASTSDARRAASRLVRRDARNQDASAPASPPQTAMPDASSSCRIASMEPPDFRSG